MLSKRLLSIFLQPLCASAYLFTAPVMSENLSLAIGNDAIVSLANAPFMMEASGAVDDAGRPSLRLRLSFANECLRQTGPDIRFARIGSREAVVFILQTVPPDGCPDIFQPVTADYRVLLPSVLAGGKVRLVARPLSVPALHEIELRSGNQGTIATVIEAVPFSTSSFLPNITQISVAQLAEGYKLSGSVMLAPSCHPHQMSALVYEVPNEVGTPATDVVVVTASRACRGNLATFPVMIAVASPQPSTDRQVIIVNVEANAAVPIGG